VPRSTAGTHRRAGQIDDERTDFDTMPGVGIAVTRVGVRGSAALRGASERLAPIAMTALVTALGLLPLALGGGEPGREIEGPMATVILGGLITSAALNLLVLPTLALRFGFGSLRVTEETLGVLRSIV